MKRPTLFSIALIAASQAGLGCDEDCRDTLGSGGGSNDLGQLGNGSTANNSLTPVAVSALN